MRASTKWIIAGSLIGLGLATSLASRAHSAEFVSEPVQQLTDDPAPPCGPAYPLFGLDNADAGVFPVRWDAFPVGSAIDFRSMDYRVRITDLSNTIPIRNFNIEESIHPDPSGTPDAYESESHWICADLFGAPPQFNSQIVFPDSIRFGRQLGARSSQGTFHLWTDLTTSGPNAGTAVLWAQATSFQYPRVQLSELIQNQWGPGSKLFKTAPGTYELRLRKIETHGTLQIEHSVKLKLVVPESL